MKSSASRDAMNARVKEAFEKWPSLYDMPEVKPLSRRHEPRIVQVSGDPDEQQNYVNALYAACNDGDPVGRDGATIVCDQGADHDAELVVQPRGHPRGHRLKAQPGQARQDGAALGSKSK